MTQQYYPGFPPQMDGPTRKLFQHLFDRVNYLINEIEIIKALQVPVGRDVEDRVRRAEVALQAVQDALTQGGAFVAFGNSQPFSETQAVDMSGSGDGFEITGPSNGATINVDDPAAARTALDAAQAESPGAHTITLAALTGGGAQGSITWNADGVVSAYVDPT